MVNFSVDNLYRVYKVPIVEWTRCSEYKEVCVYIAGGAYYTHFVENCACVIDRVFDIEELCASTVPVNFAKISCVNNINYKMRIVWLFPNVGISFKDIHLPMSRSLFRMCYEEGLRQDVWLSE